MEKQLILLCVAFIAASSMCLAQTSPSPSTPSELPANATMIADLENSVWQAYKNNQTRSLRKLLYKTYYGLYADGIKTIDMEVADMAKTDLQRYSLADFKVGFPNANIAIITYKATQQATSGQAAYRPAWLAVLLAVVVVAMAACLAAFLAAGEMAHDVARPPLGAGRNRGVGTGLAGGVREQPAVQSQGFDELSDLHVPECASHH